MFSQYCRVSLVPSSPHRGGGEPSTIYHVHDIQSRPNLIMWGWKKPGTHARSSKSAFKTTTVFFLGRCSFSVSPSSLLSAKYSCPCKTSRFLESVLTTQSIMMLAYKQSHNTQQITLPFILSGAMSDTVRSYYIHKSTFFLQFMTIVLCHHSYHRL